MYRAAYKFMTICLSLYEFLYYLQVNKSYYAVLKFGGGCQGCSAVDMTLKSGVEKTLKERIPELSAVRDKTDHSVRDNAYFR